MTAEAPAITNLGYLMKLDRNVKGQSQREVGESLGLETKVIGRLDKGKPLDQKTMLLLINWLFQEKASSQQATLI